MLHLKKLGLTDIGLEDSLFILLREVSVLNHSGIEKWIFQIRVVKFSGKVKKSRKMQKFTPKTTLSIRFIVFNSSFAFQV